MLSNSFSSRKMAMKLCEAVLILAAITPFINSQVTTSAQSTTTRSTTQQQITAEDSTTLALLDTNQLLYLVIGSLSLFFLILVCTVVGTVCVNRRFRRNLIARLSGLQSNFHASHNEETDQENNIAIQQPANNLKPATFSGQSVPSQEDPNLSQLNKQESPQEGFTRNLASPAHSQTSQNALQQGASQETPQKSSSQQSSQAADPGSPQQSAHTIPSQKDLDSAPPQQKSPTRKVSKTPSANKDSGSRQRGADSSPPPPKSSPRKRPSGTKDSGSRQRSAEDEDPQNPPKSHSSQRNEQATPQDSSQDNENATRSPGKRRKAPPQENKDHE